MSEHSSMKVGILFFLIFVLFGVAGYRSHSQTPDIAHQKEAYRSLERNTYCNQPLNRHSCSQDQAIELNNPSQKRDEEGTEYWPSFMGLRLKITDSLLAIFTFFLVLFTGGLWFSTHRLWEAAKEAFDVERAWITMDAHRTAPYSGQIDDLQVIHGLRFQIVWINSGRSPAINCEFYISHRVVDFDKTDTQRFSQSPPSSTIANVIIGPGRTAVSVERAINDLEYQAFIARKIKVIIYGSVRYASPAFTKRGKFFTEVYAEVSYAGTVKGPEGAKQVLVHFTPVGSQNSAT